MSERTVEIAVSISGQTAQQVVCRMLGAAGAQVTVCDDVTAILNAAGSIQAIVLDLGAAAEGTLAAIGTLRARLAKAPIYVIADPEGQRHAEEAMSRGATEVIPRQDLRDRVDELVRVAAQTAGISSWSIRAAAPPPPPPPPSPSPLPLVTPGKTQPGYDIESIALDDWLKIPGNRRLLGLADDPEGEDPVLTDHPEDPDEDEDADPLAPRGPAPGARAPAPTGDDGGQHPCSGAGCPRLLNLKADHETRIATALRTGREQYAHLEHLILGLRHDLQTHINTGLRPIIDQKLARSEALAQVTTKVLVDDAVSEARRESAAAIQRLHFIIAALVLVLLLGAIGVLWRSDIL